MRLQPCSRSRIAASSRLSKSRDAGAAPFRSAAQQRARSPVIGRRIGVEARFHAQGQQLDSVPMAQARTRIASGLRSFKTAVNQDLRSLGMLDDERIRVRGRYQKVAIALLIAAALLVAPAVFAAQQYRRLAVPGRRRRCCRWRHGSHLLWRADAAVERRRAPGGTLARVSTAPEGRGARQRSR